MRKSLGDIAQIKFGFYAKKLRSKGIPYLQVKHFDSNGNMITYPDTYIAPEEINSEQLLNDGDVLFAGKGYKNFAWCYRSSFGVAIASTTFFVLTPKQDIVIPEYLATVLNLPKNQMLFQHLGAGNDIPSIRKSELAVFPVPVVPLPLQAKIVALYDLHKKDINLSLQLLQYKNELYESVINTLVTNN